jgi:hypothetical protein
VTDKLIRFFRRKFPPERTERIQAWTIIACIPLFLLVPFLPIGLGVRVVNLISVFALVIAALAGLDSARNP